MDKYFLLSNSTEESEVGLYQQTKGVPDKYNFSWLDNSNSMTQLSSDIFPDFEPELIWELEDNAKLTDLIKPSNISAKGLLVNIRLKELLAQYKILDHRFYNSTLICKKQNLDYYWLHIVNKDLKGIDFNRSTFVESDLFEEKIRGLQINSEIDFNEALENRLDKCNTIIPEKLFLSDSFKKLDLFFIPLIHSYLIASERLTDKLRKEKISGLCIQEINWI